jgi:RNA polymerase sigma factor (sigma-70 family)
MFGHASGRKTDRELIESYATDRNDAVFAELVARYSPMVYRACLRVLGNAGDAEDATQAAFLVLARKAGSLRQEGRLNGWLHRVACQVALQALRVRADRERRQELVAVSQESMTVDTPEVDREVVFQAVDAELDGLSAVLREALVLRYLRGFSEQDAATQAGCPLGTMKWRASAGIAKLRQRLAKRGVALGGVALASLLTSEASAAVPETLLPSILATVKTAVATTATATGTTSTVAMLAKGAMKAMFLAKVKMVVAVAAVIAVGGAGVTTYVAVAKEQANPEPQMAAAQPKPSAAEAGVKSAGVAVAQVVDTGAPAETNTAVLVDYVRLKHKQMESAAAAVPFRVHEAFPRLFRGMETGDATAISNAYSFIRPRIGQYEARPGDPAPDPDLNNPAWQYVLDAHGAWGEFSQWTPPLLHTYANDILNSIPSNAVLFAGTDPGRFVLSAFNAVAGTNGVLIVTQNALADNRYLDYARRLYGDRMSLPGQADSAKAFQIYVEEVNSGKRAKNAGMDIKDGRVTVEGVAGVMEINGILAQMIFERNKDKHQFFEEESYVIPWMYPFLTPHGLILRLNSEPTALTADMVAEDHAFWARYEAKLRSQATFGADTRAQKTYAKMRSAMGGVYAFRGRFDDAEKAFMQARRLFPESPEVNYRLVQEVLLRQNRFAEALRVMNQYREILPSWVKICAKEGEAIELRTEQDKVDRMIEYIKTLEAQQGTGTWQQKTQDER